MANRYRPLGLAVLCALSAATAHAQQVPDAGEAIRELESTPLDLPPAPSLELNLPDTDKARPASDGPTLMVSGFRVSGNQALSDAELLALLDDLKGQTLSLGELRAADRRLSIYYREHGYLLARAYLPAQEVEGGMVEIAILEGRYGDIEVQNRSSLRPTALAPLDTLQPGEAVRAAPLERTLLLLSDMPGVDVEATLQPGESVGASDLIVEVLPGPLVSGSLELDNYGSRYTGRYRLGGSLNLNNPLGLADVLSLRALVSDEQQHYYRAAYQLPLGPWATRVGASYSDMDYQLAEDFEDLDAHGNARIASVFLIQPLIRGRDLSLYGQLQFDDKRLEDEVEQFDSVSEKRSQVWIASLTGNARDALGGGGITSFALSYTHGNLEIIGEIDQMLDDLTARTRGDFAKVELSLLRLQRLTRRFSLQARLRGQWADQNLDSSEAFSLGGAHGVRAYPQGEAAGDQGWLANLELRYALSPAWQLSAFADHGAVRLNEDPWSEADNHRSLSGAGIGARWSAKGWHLSATAAWELGSEEPRSGKDRSPRVWAQVLHYF